MKNKFHVLFFLLPFSAHAFMIGKNVKDGGEASTCRILYRTAEGKLAGICSGTLVSSTKVITAAHCINKTAPNASVECGFEGTEGEAAFEQTAGGSNVQTKGVKFKESRTDIVAKVEDFADTSPMTDVAMFELKTPITTIETASFTPNPGEAFFEADSANSGEYDYQRLKEGVVCKIEGYGISNDGNSGRLKYADYKGPVFNTGAVLSRDEEQELATLTNDQQVELKNCMDAYLAEMIPKNFIPLAKLLATHGAFNGSVAHGDSGGPILCQKKGETKWSLVGVASTGGVWGKEGKPNTIVAGGQWHLFTDEDRDVLMDGKVRPKVEDPFEDLPATLDELRANELKDVKKSDAKKKDP